MTVQFNYILSKNKTIRIYKYLATDFELEDNSM